MESSGDHVAESLPNACPGTKSETAGKVSACQGCPNQKICASGATAAPNPAIDQIRHHLSSVRHIVLVLSGKGGVGKSTFAAQLAFGIAADSAKQVSVLDVDICGPSIPRIMGLEGEQVHASGSGYSPVYVDENIGVMSVGFLLPSPDDAVIWRGPKKHKMIETFLQDVDWGELDYLVVDTPPGTSDEHLSTVNLLGSANVSGAVIITTPQEVSLLDVRKEINFCKRIGVRVIGVVENMSGFVCPKCHNQTDIFAATTGGAETMASEMAVPFLGRLPLDPRIGQCSDEGRSFVSDVPDSPAAIAFKHIINEIMRVCETEETVSVEAS